LAKHAYFGDIEAAESDSTKLSRKPKKGFLAVIISSSSPVTMSTRGRDTGRAPRDPVVSGQPLLMELDVPVADYTLRSELDHYSTDGHRDTKLIVDARLAVVFHCHAEGATVAAGAGEQDRLR
jgi:hypothetical protein